MKLKVYQQGGGLIYTPFIPGAQGVSGSSSSGSSDDDSKLDPLDKELLALMKDQNLLPSDIQMIYDRMLDFQRRTLHLSSLGGTSAYRTVMPGMLQLQQLVSLAKTNKAQWDDAANEIRHHDAGSEVAMDANGLMWVRDKEGNISKVAPSEFNREEYQPLSNSQLLYLRRGNEGMAFSDSLFGETGMDVIGMADIRKEIDDIISKFGSIKSGNLQLQKFSDLAQDLQGEGIYRITEKYDKADLQDFSRLLYSRLGASSRHLIDANAAMGDYDKFDYLLGIIRSETDYEREPHYEASLTKATGLGGAGGSGSDGEGPMVEKTYVENVINGTNFTWPQYNRFALIGKHSDILAATQDTGAIQSGMDGGKSVGDTPLPELRKLELFTQGANQQNVMLGNQVINPSQQAAVMYDGSSLYRVELPYDAKLKAERGEIVPDWSLIDLMDTLKEKIDPNLGKEQIDRILRQYNPSLYWDDNSKTVRTKDTEWFLTFTGVIGSDFTRGINYDSDFFEEIKGSKADIWHKRYDAAMKNSYASEGLLGKLTKTHLYKVNVFMPITNKLAGTSEYAFKQNRTHNMQTQAVRDMDVYLENRKKSGDIITNFTTE